MPEQRSIQKPWILEGVSACRACRIYLFLSYVPLSLQPTYSRPSLSLILHHGTCTYLALNCGGCSTPLHISLAPLDSGIFNSAPLRCSGPLSRPVYSSSLKLDRLLSHPYLRASHRFSSSPSFRPASPLLPSPSAIFPVFVRFVQHVFSTFSILLRLCLPPLGLSLFFLPAASSMRPLPLILLLRNMQIHRICRVYAKIFEFLLPFMAVYKCFCLEISELRKLIRGKFTSFS